MVDAYRVLVVDDDDDTREMLDLALGIEGARVEGTECGERALPSNIETGLVKQR